MHSKQLIIVNTCIMNKPGDSFVTLLHHSASCPRFMSFLKHYANDVISICYFTHHKFYYEYCLYGIDEFSLTLNRTWEHALLITCVKGIIFSHGVLYRTILAKQNQH